MPSQARSPDLNAGDPFGPKDENMPRHIQPTHQCKAHLASRPANSLLTIISRPSRLERAGSPHLRCDIPHQDRRALWLELIIRLERQATPRLAAGNELRFLCQQRSAQVPVAGRWWRLGSANAKCQRLSVTSDKRGSTSSQTHGAGAIKTKARCDQQLIGDTGQLGQYPQPRLWQSGIQAQRSRTQASCFNHGLGTRIDINASSPTAITAGGGTAQSTWHARNTSIDHWVKGTTHQHQHQCQQQWRLVVVEPGGNADAVGIDNNPPSTLVTGNDSCCRQLTCLRCCHQCLGYSR